MLRFIRNRLLMMIPIVLGISFIVLLLLEITPGDPAKMLLGTQATPERLAALRAQLGLDDPILVRFVNFLWQIVHGDFGTSFMTKRPVFEEMIMRMPYTLVLVGISLAVSVGLGIPLGVYAATHHNTWKDNGAMFISLFFVSMPVFWFALLLVRFFGVELRWLPLSGIDSWQSWILPIVATSLGFVATIARQTRSNMLEVIRQDYIVTAKAKGLPERKVIYRHALKNALIPIIMVIGNMFGLLIGGALITEVIFGIPGLGQYTIAGLTGRDYPVIQGSVFMLSVMFSLVILIVDVVFAIVDPRIRSQSGRKKHKDQKDGNKIEENTQKIEA
ncbi:MAG: ABC transporter permease [Clostridiales Family XIII bacterium]|jgi:peptide/nickel transport system permease protein|nr:ABC transporter permease [Clostridiales Family XIII bacterium]